MEPAQPETTGRPAAASDPRGRLRQILVATDFSACAGAAYEWALRTADMHGAGITLVHAADTSSSPPNLPEYIQQDLNHHVETHLSGLQKLAESKGISVTGEYDAGRPWTVILEAAARHNPDLIVVGTRGRSAFSRLLLGSVAERIIRHATMPVVTVHPSDARRPFRLRSVLAAIDFSDASLRAAREGIRLLSAGSEPSKLVLFHAAHTPIDYDAGAVAAVVYEHVEKMAEDARDQLRAQAAGLNAPEHINIEIASEVGHPVTMISECAETMDADLITLGTAGHTGLAHVVMGSVAERVLHHASCPVLTLHEGSGPPCPSS